jgi:phosphoglycolate phosphatase-like HAD superfamily hydrolase
VTATPTDTVDTVVLDVDGTLVDSNYQHAIAWYRAFRGVDVHVPVWEIHRHIGMGGDQLVAALGGDELERRHGDDLRAAHGKEFAPFRPEVLPLPGAQALLRAIKDRGLRLVLASSGQPDDVAHYVDLLEAGELADAWTSSADVERTKPAPDLIEVAIGKVDGAHAVVVGDSTWDLLSAGRLGVPGFAVHTGGFSEEELREAGAREVFDSLDELREHLDRVVRPTG